MNMEEIMFWVQVRGIPPYLCSEANVRKLADKVGEFVELEDIEKARGFLRVKVAVDTSKPLATGCWVPREDKNESWIEFRYERLQDFCYKCGRIGHANTECTFTASKGGMAGYGEWTRVAAVRDLPDPPKPLAINLGERRQAGAKRMGGGSQQQHRREENCERTRGKSRMEQIEPQVPGHDQNAGDGRKKWQRIPRSWERLNLA